MKASQLPLGTEKEDPRDAQVVSHSRLSRSGFIKKQSSGFYTFMPLGYMVHRKIEEIIRQKMMQYGAIELHLPVLTPDSLWEQSGRWQKMGPEMMRVQDRHGNFFALAPTHEEAITFLAQQILKSYKSLPINLFQIGNKYRDEIRPRYGLIRGREFVMKDAYSFHIDDASLHETYEKMRNCYRDIFQECGLETIAVEADSGNMGGAGSEEFMVASTIGEETLLLCEDQVTCGYKSNQEKTAYISETTKNDNNGQPVEKVATPGQTTISQVSAFLNSGVENFIKAVIYETESEIAICFIPGNRDLSDVKLKNLVTGLELSLASEEVVKKVTSAEPGYAGPVSLPVMNNQKLKIDKSDKPIVKTVKIFVDQSLEGRKNLVSGANETGFHLKNINEGKDFTACPGVDLVIAGGNDLCPSCKKHRLSETRGIEVGHIFKLGKKYTEALKVEVLGSDGRPHVPTMGCYGIGVGRTLATVVEQNHDEYGIIWPESLSPYKYHLIGLFKKEEEKQPIDDLYEEMLKAGLSVYYDDRNERPGVKFNDADLVGMPWQIIAGKNYVQSGNIELKNRRSQEKTEINREQFLHQFK